MVLELHKLPKGQTIEGPVNGLNEIYQEWLDNKKDGETDKDFLNCPLLTSYLDVNLMLSGLQKGGWGSMKHCFDKMREFGVLEDITLKQKALDSAIWEFKKRLKGYE
jgi:hypothetical protein